MRCLATRSPSEWTLWHFPFLWHSIIPPIELQDVYMVHGACTVRPWNGTRIHRRAIQLHFLCHKYQWNVDQETWMESNFLKKIAIFLVRILLFHLKIWCCFCQQLGPELIRLRAKPYGTIHARIRAARMHFVCKYKFIWLFLEFSSVSKVVSFTVVVFFAWLNWIKIWCTFVLFSYFSNAISHYVFIIVIISQNKITWANQRTENRPKCNLFWHSNLHSTHTPSVQSSFGSRN